MRVISVDVGWKTGTKRNAVVVSDHRGNVLHWDFRCGDEEILDVVQQYAMNGTRVLLDIPVEGCEGLGKAQPFRPIDYALLKNRISLYPSVRAGMRGASLKQQVTDRCAGRDVVVLEIYPYALYKFLSFLEKYGKLTELSGGEPALLLDRDFKAFRTCKYKNVKSHEQHSALRYLKSLLEQPALGLRFGERSLPPVVPPLAYLTDLYDAGLEVQPKTPARLADMV